MARRFVMEFERPLVELEEKLEQLRRIDIGDNVELSAEIDRLAAEISSLHETLYESLGPWERVQVARHPDRPKTQDFVGELFEDVFELRGDRLYGDDEAVLAALGRLDGRSVVVVGHRKGKDIKENVRRHFGSAHPEGFRKALRAMRLAERFGLPVVSFVDTPGAYPGMGAEERGQAWAIAENLSQLAELGVPVVVVCIGEGGSGGALAIGFGDRLLMLENSYYSVSSPEACASILYKDAARAADVAGCLALTSDDLMRLGIADGVVAEPFGGAHRDPAAVFVAVRDAITAALTELERATPDELVARRYDRVRRIGAFAEEAGAAPAAAAGPARETGTEG